MSDEAKPEVSASPAGFELSDEFKTFLMSHKDEVMRLLKDSSATSSKDSSEKKFKDSSSSESESSMPRRRRDSTSSNDCDSDVAVEKSEEGSRSRSRTPHSPIRYHRREQRERSDSRSRSRSRSSTPARYERHLRRLSRENPSGRGRGYYRGGGPHYSTHHHHHSHHQPFYGPHPNRGESGGENYETGARRGGFIRMRNAMEDGRDNPTPSKCLGVFGMPPWIREYDMRSIFEQYGEIDQLNVVINRHTGQCRGYGFVYYSSVEDAKRARSAMRDAKIDGIPIRVDFSVTDQRRRSSRDS
ncbi:hypothetical protein PRIPAC_76067 [Pristionchus pacificus]|uniref:RNA binding protein n=1 Tax=Pristionchus pacificus TaxID=54126 RepID=A0A2A6BFE2_PRIPA|nr:hypothetical protein PRIPAC_76067 [Pristionchus pacificus]|eukprot:PDM64573.1 RNA binding protein [Pristionchus pacificus]